MKKYLTLLALPVFVLFFSSRAQIPSPSLGKNDPEATVILKKASSLYKSYQSLKADFSLEIADIQGKQVSRQTGTIWLKGNDFKFQLGEMEVYSNGKEVWNYNKTNKEAQLTDYEPGDGEITPSSLFSDFYEKNFLYRLNGPATFNGKEASEIEMTPLDKSMSYFKILVWIDKASNRLLGMKIFDKSGYRYEYQIKNYQPNLPLSSGDFVFDKSSHPGVKVVDLRM